MKTSCVVCDVVLCALLFAGHLHIANVIENDSLLALDEHMRYVCIVNNPLLQAFLQGDDQKIRPIARGMGLDVLAKRHPLVAACKYKHSTKINLTFKLQTNTHSTHIQGGPKNGTVFLVRLNFSKY